MDADPRRASGRDALGIAALSAAGLAVAGWLTYLHARLHLDPGYEPTCAVGEAVNCETVAASPYSVFLGMPVSVWGCLAYLAALALAIAEVRKRQERGTAGLLAALAIAMALGSAALAYVSFAVIGSLCPFCLASYLVNLLLAVAALRLVHRQGGLVRCLGAEIGALRKNRWVAVYGVLVSGLLAVAGPGGGFPRYWEASAWLGGPDLPHGIDAEGRPWLGAARPSVVVEEFFDYDCPHCRAAHRKLRRLLSGHRDALRIERSDFARAPCVDAQGHKLPARCRMLRAAYCMAQKDRFWQWNDRVVADPKPVRGAGRKSYEQETAAMLGVDRAFFERCIDSDAAYGYGQRCYERGAGARITGTPVYRVGGKRTTLKALAELVSKK